MRRLIIHRPTHDGGWQGLANSSDPSPTSPNPGWGSFTYCYITHTWATSHAWAPALITDGNTIQDNTPVLAPVPDSTLVVEHVLLLKGHVLLTDQ